MKTIVNNFIPFSGYLAINIFGFLFVRRGMQSHIDAKAINHEKIHTEQQKEVTIVGIVLAVALWYSISWWSLLFILLFYGLYFLEWAISLPLYKNATRAYHAISFEREAYANEDDFVYLENRKRFAWLKHVFK